MDRNRTIREIKLKGISLAGEQLRVLRQLGEGGNGVALLCSAPGAGEVVAKVYLPPDARDLDQRALERFNNEIRIVSKINHPNVVRALASGTLNLGAYTLPFYTMPHAPRTLRDIVKSGGANEVDTIEKRARLFLRAALGVACLHSHGIFHRDLKPENILISADGSPWVADLGIAHVNPGFASGGVETIASERLLNRDYYAPEQRFGSATAVDQRADIYALGYMLYELLAGFPPVRSSSPPLGKINEAFAPFEPIFSRMTAHDPKGRYRVLEDAIEELSMAFGWVLATVKGARPAASADVPTMQKLLKSSNEAHRQSGVDLAVRLGGEAVPALHLLIGQSRRVVRNAAATALGKIKEPASVPYLIASLYSATGSTRASQFKPSADTAAESLSNYPPEVCVDACGSISHPIRPLQVSQLLKNVPRDQAYELAHDLIARKKMILLDWGESPLWLFAQIDQERAWPEIKQAIESAKLADYQIRQGVQQLSEPRRSELLRVWVTTPAKYGYYFDDMLLAIRESRTDGKTKRELLTALASNIDGYRGALDGREAISEQISSFIAELEPQPSLGRPTS